MKMIGNDVYIQRGETFSLDFSVRNEYGRPFTVLSIWDNPYIAITVASGLYEQEGDFRETYWLDMSNRWVEQSDGSVKLEPAKKFIYADALFVSAFTIADALIHYGVDAGGKIALDSNSDFDITNYLFFTDPLQDGNYVYKYVKDYKLVDGAIASEVWAEYDFRIIKQFDTKSWMEQQYYFDIKVLAGESIEEHIARALQSQGITVSTDAWSDVMTQEYINLMTDDDDRRVVQELFDEGVPLMPNYDTKSLIIQPAKLYVGANIQGGVK